MYQNFKIKCFLCNDFKYNNTVCDHNLDFGHLDYEYNIKNKKKIRTFLLKKNIINLSEVLPFKKKYNYQLPQIAIKNYNKIDKQLKNKIYFVIDYFNFSGSFKDRASLISCLYAKENGYKEITLASSGNAAISTATFANMLDLKTSVFLPSFVSEIKKKTLKDLGCKIFEFNDSYSYTVKQSILYSKKFNTFNRSSAINPISRDGKKLFSYEILNDLKSKNCDYIMVPVGDANIISGICKGLIELKSLNFLSKIPKLIGIQSSQSLSFYRQFKANSPFPIKSSADSKCDSINVDQPLDAFYAYKYLKKIKGDMLKVSDNSILSSKKYLLKNLGINCCLASASTFASLKVFINKNKIKNKNFFLVLTGSGFKDSMQNK